MKLRGNFKKIRKAWGENQTEFGARFGLSISNISSYEKADVMPPIQMLLKLEKLSGISIKRWIEDELEPRELPAFPLDSVEAKPPPPAYERTEKEELTDYLKLIEVVKGLMEETESLRRETKELKKEIEELKGGRKTELPF